SSLQLKSMTSASRSAQGRHRYDRVSRRVSSQRAEEGPGGEVEDPAVLADHEVAVGEADHAGDGLVELRAAHRALEAGVAEGEDAAVGGHQPVALAGGGRDERLDRGVEPGAAHRAVEPGVAEGEDAAVAGHHVVALARGRRDRVEDGPVE